MILLSPVAGALPKKYIILWTFLGFQMGIFCSGLQGVETGDVDGDGRLTIGDVVRLWNVLFLDPAPGSVDGLYEHFPSCGSGVGELYFAGLTYLELIRRRVPGSLPHWYPIWPHTTAVEPVLPDDRIRVRLENAAAPGGLNDRVSLEVVLNTDEPISAFAFFIESSNSVLRPFDSKPSRLFLDSITDENNSKEVGTSAATFLISGGRLVLSYGLAIVKSVLPPGEHRFLVKARLPRGLPPGLFTIRILPGSEVILGDGNIVSPTVSEPAELIALSEVLAGWDEGVPPLRFVPESRRILGRIEYLVVRGDGSAAKPVAEVRPGEPFRLRIQMRTEVPLNRSFVKLTWPSNEFCDLGGSITLFTNPEDGKPYVFFPYFTGTSDTYLAGFAIGHALGGNEYSSRAVTYPDRPLEYFKPINEWTDLGEAELKVPEYAPGGRDIQLRFLPYSRGLTEQAPFAFPGFMPYAPDWCEGKSETGDLPAPPWQYSVSYENNFVRVLEPLREVEEPTAGIRFLIGEASGSPGDLVKVPVSAFGSKLLIESGLVLAINPELVDVEAIEVPITHPRTSEIRIVTIPRGKVEWLGECFDPDGDGRPDSCVDYFPSRAKFHDLPSRDRVFFDFSNIAGSAPKLNWIGPEKREVFRLLVRIREGLSAAEAAIVPGEAAMTEGLLHEIIVKSGGVPLQRENGCRIWQPAENVEPGRILIRSDAAARFIRGDSNADGQADVSDAVWALSYLYLGGTALECDKAGDSDDSGVLDVSDAIYLLEYLFLGARPGLPVPFPGCGNDGTPDDLTCKRYILCQ